MKPFLVAVARSAQVMAMLTVLSGLYLGLRGVEMGVYLTLVAVGAGLFYLAAYLQRKWA